MTTTATTLAPATAISPSQLEEIGLNQMDSYIIYYLSTILTPSKSMEMLTVYIREEMEQNNRSFKTHLTALTDDYDSWRQSASSDHDHLSPIADRTIEKTSNRYDIYLGHINTAKNVFASMQNI